MKYRDIAKGFPSLQLSFGPTLLGGDRDEDVDVGAWSIEHRACGTGNGKRRVENGEWIPIFPSSEGQLDVNHCLFFSLFFSRKHVICTPGFVRRMRVPVGSKQGMSVVLTTANVEDAAQPAHYDDQSYALGDTYRVPSSSGHVTAQAGAFFVFLP